ncbi:6169_t:CDS:2 [Diversispora eburnea]|uniref:6169_t:CDS:1 n=1 Tax=Diversispora eburnea TaxID=1213867 RepID=A0A9N8Z8F0_9GLOM|nr:6169_t:CDS:2 [Diversispora eburnea]
MKIPKVEAVIKILNASNIKRSVSTKKPIPIKSSITIPTKASTTTSTKALTSTTSTKALTKATSIKAPTPTSKGSTTKSTATKSSSIKRTSTTTTNLPTISTKITNNKKPMTIIIPNKRKSTITVSNDCSNDCSSNKRNSTTTIAISKKPISPIRKKTNSYPKLNVTTTPTKLDISRSNSSTGIMYVFNLNF